MRFFSFCKRKANSAIEQQKCEGFKKRDRLLVSKVEFSSQTSKRNIFFLLMQVSQVGLFFIEKVLLINYFRNSKSLKGIYFFES